MTTLHDGTLSAIESIEGISFDQAMLDRMATELQPVNRPDTDFDCRYGSHLSLQTALSVAEQLYRYRIHLRTLAVILTGTVGDILTNMMIASITKRKRRAKNESSHEGTHKRTSFRNVRNMWAEFEFIKETALSILFESVERLKLVVPFEVRSTHDLASGHKWFKPDRVWTTFSGFMMMADEPAPYAAFMNAEERDLLDQICRHNVDHMDCPNMWQFCLLTTHSSEFVQDLVEDKSVLTVRRCKKSFEAQLNSCIIAAFGAAAYRFIVLEFGHNSEAPKGMLETRQEKFSSRNPEMIPLEDSEELLAVATRTQRAIINVCCTANVETATQALTALRETGYSIDTNRFWNEWGGLIETAKAVASGKTIDRPIVPQKIMTDTFRNSRDNKNRYIDLHYGDSVECGVPQKSPERLVIPYNPDGSSWSVIKDGQWVFEKSGVFIPDDRLAEFADYI